MFKEVLKFCIFGMIACVAAHADTCIDMYNSFKPHIEPQMTELCDTQIPGYHGYKFYLSDEKEGYVNAMLVFTAHESHLYIENDSNPFKCTGNRLQKTETTEEILKILFIPQLDKCEPGFKEKIDI